jgi:hypothetical protein
MITANTLTGCESPYGERAFLTPSFFSIGINTPVAVPALMAVTSSGSAVMQQRVELGIGVNWCPILYNLEISVIGVEQGKKHAFDPILIASAFYAHPNRDDLPVVGSNAKFMNFAITHRGTIPQTILGQSAQTTN